MTNYEYITHMSVDEMAEWLDKYGMFDSSPWMSWFDELYCKRCPYVMCKSADDSRIFPCSYCEVYDTCRFFQDLDEVPDNKMIVKMWLESEVE